MKMKNHQKHFILILALAISSLLIPRNAAAGIDFCDTIPEAKKITVNSQLFANVIRSTLINYNTITDGGIPKYLITDGNYSAYCLVFNITAVLNGFNIEFPLSLNDDHDVYVKNLNISSNDDLASLLRVTNLSADKKIYLINSTFQNVENGITLEGTGVTELHGVNVQGDTSKIGSCIDIKSPDAVLDDVESKGCGVGIKVEANSATFTSSGDVTTNIDPEDSISDNISNISENKIGVHIMSGVTGTKITRSRIFGNDDGVNDEGIADDDYVKKSDFVRMEDGAPTRLVFYDGQGEDIVPVDEDMTETIDYGDRPVYINIPLAGRQNLTGSVTIDFSATGATTGKVDFYEVIGITPDQPAVDIQAQELVNNNIYTLHIPVRYLNRRLTAIYNDPLYGTTSLSQPFMGSNDSIVIFVSDPFEQTTTGNPMDAGGDDGTGDGGGDGGGGDGGGGGGGATAAKLCTFIPDSAGRTVSGGAALWWLLLLAPAATLATIRRK